MFCSPDSIPINGTAVLGIATYHGGEMHFGHVKDVPCDGVKVFAVGDDLQQEA